MHAVLAKMIGADVADHRDIGLGQRKPAPQQAAARGFQHRRFDVGATQQLARAARAGVIAAFETLDAGVVANARTDTRAYKKPIGAGMRGAQSLRAQHRRDQAHGGGLAVGTGDQRGGNLPKCRPWHLVRGRQRIHRPRAPMHAQAKAQPVVVDQGRRAVPLRGFQQQDRIGTAFGGGKTLQRVQRHDGVVAGGMAGRMQPRVADAGAPRPFVDFGRGVQQVGRGDERQRRAGAMHTHHRFGLRPAQGLARGFRAQPPRGKRHRVARLRSHGFERGTAAGEVHVGTSKPPRVFKRRLGRRCVEKMCSHSISRRSRAK